MRTHKRLFPLMAPNECEALIRMCNLRQSSSAQALQLYAVQGLEPTAIAEQLGIEYTNVHRTLKKAQGYLEDARQALGLQ